MADSDNVVAENDNENIPSKLDEQLQSDEPPTEIKGWLMKRSKRTHKWAKRWFHLNNTELNYGHSEQNTPKKIQLQNADVSEAEIDNKNNVFRIKPKDCKRTYYIMAEDESSQTKWMQAILYVKAGGGSGENSQACVVQ